MSPGIRPAGVSPFDNTGGVGFLPPSTHPKHPAGRYPLSDTLLPARRYPAIRRLEMDALTAVWLHTAALRYPAILAS